MYQSWVNDVTCISHGVMMYPPLVNNVTAHISVWVNDVVAHVLIMGQSWDIESETS